MVTLDPVIPWDQLLLTPHNLLLDCRNLENLLPLPLLLKVWTRHVKCALLCVVDPTARKKPSRELWNDLLNRLGENSLPNCWKDLFSSSTQAQPLILRHRCCQKEKRRLERVPCYYMLRYFFSLTSKVVIVADIFIFPISKSVVF
jgi:hypothetical protein